MEDLEIKAVMVRALESTPLDATHCRHAPWPARSSGLRKMTIQRLAQAQNELLISFPSRPSVLVLVTVHG
jgi:hypothetical protein